MDASFDEIYREYAPGLYRFLLRLCGNEAIAEELLQDTMLRAIESADSFRGGCSVSTWLCTIGRNLWRDRCKSAAAGDVPLDCTAEPSEAPQFLLRLEDREMALQIHRLLHCLAEPYREVFSLRVFAELKFRDIGEIFGQSEAWARMTFFRAKKQLIEECRKDGIYETD